MANLNLPSVVELNARWRRKERGVGEDTVDHVDLANLNSTKLWAKNKR